MYKSQFMINNSMMMHSFQDNVGSKTMLAHILLSLLVFEHGFIQIHFGSFEFFYNFFIDAKHYAMNVGY